MIRGNNMRMLSLRECIAGINRGELGIFNFDIPASIRP